MLDSSYFAVVTFTTIGYGDLVPDTTDARIFTCFWALSGVACLGISLGVVGSNLIDVHETKRIKVQHESNNKVIGLFDAHGGDKTTKNNNSNNVANTYISIEEGKRRIMYDYLEDDNDDRQERATEQCCTCKCTCSPKAIRITGLLIFFCGVLYLISRCEGWDVTTTIYYGIITGRFGLAWPGLNICMYILHGIAIF